MSAAAKPPCVIGKLCAEHQFVHGAEAEQLRAKAEEFIARLNSAEAREGIDSQVVADDLQDLLDSVDARDSLAFVEVKPRRYTHDYERKVRPRTKPKKKAKKR